MEVAKLKRFKHKLWDLIEFMILLRSKIVFLRSVMCLFTVRNSMKLNLKSKFTENIPKAKWEFNYFKHLWKLSRSQSKKKNIQMCTKLCSAITVCYDFFLLLRSDHSWNNYKQFNSLIIGRKNVFSAEKCFCCANKTSKHEKHERQIMKGWTNGNLMVSSMRGENLILCRKTEKFCREIRFIWKRNQKISMLGVGGKKKDKNKLFDSSSCDSASCFLTKKKL